MKKVKVNGKAIFHSKEWYEKNKLTMKVKMICMKRVKLNTKAIFYSNILFVKHLCFSLHPNIYVTARSAFCVVLCSQNSILTPYALSNS